MSFIDFSKREKFLSIITLGILFIVLFCNFVIAPLFSKMESLNEKIRTNEIRLERNLKIISRKDDIQSQYSKYSQLLKQKNSDEQEMALFLAGIEAIARKVAIRITDMKPRDIKTEDFFKRLTVDIELEANLGELTEFIYNLQNASDLYVIDRFRIEKKSRRSSSLKGYLRVSRDLIQ
jgi:Tfp pilus assembly protein PilO